MNAKAFFAAVGIGALGLTATGTVPETQAAKHTAAVETVVPTDFKTTWDLLVRELDEGDFTINATIWENSTIRVLLQSAIPSTWVDCGTVTVNSKHEAFGNRTYKFLAANSVRYLVPDETADELVDVERRTTLNALATIKLKPVRRGTLVNIDAHYAMKVKTREFGNNIPLRSLDESLDFGSGGQARVTEQIREGAKMKMVTNYCRPTGELERRIAAVLGVPAS